MVLNTLQRSRCRSAFTYRTSVCSGSARRRISRRVSSSWRSFPAGTSQIKASLHCTSWRTWAAELFSLPTWFFPCGFGVVLTVIFDHLGFYSWAPPAVPFQGRFWWCPAAFIVLLHLMPFQSLSYLVLVVAWRVLGQSCVFCHSKPFSVTQSHRHLQMGDLGTWISS